MSYRSQTVKAASSKRILSNSEDRWHCYVLHFNVKGKDYYGLITRLEYEDFKRIKDDFSFLTPELCLSPLSNFTISFDW